MAQLTAKRRQAAQRLALLVPVGLAVSFAAAVWAQAPSLQPAVDTDRMFKGAMFADSRRGYAFGTGYLRGESSLIATEDGGATWRLVLDFPRHPHVDGRAPDVERQRDDIWVVSFLDQSHFWVRTLERQLQRTADGGRTFEILTPDLVDPSGQHITSWVDQGMQFVNPRVGYAVAAANVYRTGDGGRTWSPRPVPRAMGNVTQIWFFDENDGVAATSRGFQGVVRTSDGGRTWTGVANTPSFDRLSCTRTGFCAGLGLRPSAGSFLLVSRDRGKTWRDTKLQLVKGEADWSGERIADVQAVAPNRVFLAGTIEDTKQRGLLLTWDGAKWTRRSYAEPREVAGVYFLDASSGWLVAHDSAKRLYRTTDGGSTVSYVPDYFTAAAALADR